MRTPNIEILKGKPLSYLRNKNIADIFFKAGYIEVWGRGIFMMMDASRKAGLPESTIEETVGGMQITILERYFFRRLFAGTGIE